MTIAQAVLEIQALPLQQQEILDFAEFLSHKLQKNAKSQTSSQPDPIWDLGSKPISLWITDAAENHNYYLYVYQNNKAFQL